MLLEKILLTDNIIKNVYQNIDALLALIPELGKTIDFDHKHPHHHLDVFNHTLLAISLAPNNFTIRLVLLLHDIGKSSCAPEENGVRLYPNHGMVSSQMARNILTRLNFDYEYIEIICELIAKHDEKITMADINENYDFCYLLYKIQYCDALAHHPLKLDKRITYLNETKQMLISKSRCRTNNNYFI